MTKRKYRTDEEWLSLIQECRLSGLTDKQWCEAHQICPSNFYYQWIYVNTLNTKS